MWSKTRRATESHPAIRRGSATQYFDRKGRPVDRMGFFNGLLGSIVRLFVLTGNGILVRCQILRKALA